MKASKLLLIGTIIAAMCAITTMADTLSVVSDENVQVIGVINKAQGTSTEVDTSGDSMFAVRVYEPYGYPNTYLAPTDESDNSLWDTETGLVFNGTGADWIWDSSLAEGSKDFVGSLYDADASGSGRVVIFQKSFNIESNWSLISAGLSIAADNCYEVWINGTHVARSATCIVDWYTYDMMNQSVINYTGWQAVGQYDVASLLVEGENNIVVMAGNEYHGYTVDVTTGVDNWFNTGDTQDTENDPIPSWSGVDYPNAEYYQYNPGAMIFALEIEYEVIPETYSICGNKSLQLVDEEGEFLEDEGPGVGWEIYLDLWDGDSYEPYDSTETDAYGDYCFNDLPAGLYRVTEESYPGWTQVSPYDELQTGNEYAYLISLPDGASPGTYYDFLNEEVYVEVEGYCGLTQGFYGNAGGKFYLPPDFEIGIPTTDLLVGLLDAADAVTPGSDPVVVGEVGIASLTFDTAACIIELLPASGPPALLPEDDLDCHDNLVAAGLVKKNKPELNNVLIGQIVALTLNTRLDDNLGYFELPGTEEEDGVFCTAYEGGCPQQFVIPKEVIEILGEDATVYDLLALANAAIAEGAPKKLLNAINEAVTSINEAFDECALLVSCSTEEICGDGIDNDCDGYVDEDCLD